MGDYIGFWGGLIQGYTTNLLQGSCVYRVTCSEGSDPTFTKYGLCRAASRVCMNAFLKCRR